MSFDITFLPEVLKHAKPGDTLWLKNGVFTDVRVDVDCHGTAQNPITIRPEHAGELILSGGCSLNVSGSHIRLVDFKFEDAHETMLTVSGTNVRVSNCLFSNCPKGGLIVGGTENRFDHNVVGELGEIKIDDRHNIVDHSVVTSVALFVNADDNAIYNNRFARTTLENHGNNTVVAHNSFEDETSKVVVCRSENCLVFKNRFERSSRSVDVVDGSNVVVCRNVFRKVVAPHSVSGNASTTIATNRYLDCGAMLLTTDLADDTDHTTFTNNRIHNETDKHVVHDFLAEKVSYSSNVCFTHKDMGNVTGVVQSHPNDYECEPDRCGHDEKDIGFLSGKYNMESTQLFKSVRAYNEIMRANIVENL